MKDPGQSINGLKEATNRGEDGWGQETEHDRVIVQADAIRELRRLESLTPMWNGKHPELLGVDGEVSTLATDYLLDELRPAIMDLVRGHLYRRIRRARRKAGPEVIE